MLVLLVQLQRCSWDWNQSLACSYSPLVQQLLLVCWESSYESAILPLASLWAFALGLGVLFISLYQGYAERVYSILYGNILGINQTDVLVTAVLSTMTISLLFILFRPLLFSSLDPTVAETRGIPVRLMNDHLFDPSRHYHLDISASGRSIADLYFADWTTSDRHAYRSASIVDDFSLLYFSACAIPG